MLRRQIVLLCSILGLLSFGLMEVAFAQDQQGKYETKDEVIYGNLKGDGTVEQLNVVNSFEITRKGLITDEGPYTEVKNLTDLSPIDFTVNGTLSFEAKDDDFFYQGKLIDHRLPWEFQIVYKLNGEEMAPKELTGKSGELDLHINIKANEAVPSTFFKNYLVQISTTLDPAIFQQIKAPKGSKAKEGKNTSVHFTLMPETEDTFIISAQVEDFAMEPIEISAIPANIALEDPELDPMQEDMKELADAIQKINDGTHQLKDGILELNQGAQTLNNGSRGFLTGMRELSQSSKDLQAGSAAINAGLQQLSEADDPDFDPSELKQLKQLPEALKQIAQEIRQIGEGIKVLDEALRQIPEGSVDEAEIKALYETLLAEQVDEATLNTVNQLVESYEAAQRAKYIHQELFTELAQDPFVEIAQQLEIIATSLENKIDELQSIEELDQLFEGLSTLSTEYKTFHEGLNNYLTGVNTLSTSYEELNDGINTLTEGTHELQQGSQELATGTNELAKETKNLPQDMEEEMEQLMENYDFSEFEPRSFVSSNHKQIGVVQFVLQTEKIEPEEKNEAEDEGKDKKQSLWKRFLDLFRR